MRSLPSHCAMLPVRDAGGHALRCSAPGVPPPLRGIPEGLQVDGPDHQRHAPALAVGVLGADAKLAAARSRRFEGFDDLDLAGRRAWRSRPPMMALAMLPPPMKAMGRGWWLWLMGWKACRKGGGAIVPFAHAATKTIAGSVCQYSAQAGAEITGPQAGQLFLNRPQAVAQQHGLATACVPQRAISAWACSRAGGHRSGARRATGPASSFRAGVHAAGAARW